MPGAKAFFNAFGCGPWVKPEQSMQHLVGSAVEVTGPKRYDEVLPRPQRRPGFFGDGLMPTELEKAKNEFYLDESGEPV